MRSLLGALAATTLALGATPSLSARTADPQFTLAVVRAEAAKGQADAIATLGLSPLAVLVIPRTIALLLAMPLLVFIVTLLAVPLSKVNPRQGRFLKLLPAIFLYMAYLGLLIAARGALDKGRLPPALGLWWVHGIFFAIGMVLLYWECLSLWWGSRRAPVAEVAHG